MLGLTGAAAGPAPAAWGGARLVGATPRWWKVPATAGLVAIAFVVVSTLGVPVAAQTCLLVATLIA